MLARQLLLFAERWWIVLLGLCPITFGIFVYYLEDLLIKVGATDIPRMPTPHPAYFVVGFGVAFLLINMTPRMQRYWAKYFGMRNIRVHHKITFVLGVLGPVIACGVLEASMLQIWTGWHIPFLQYTRTCFPQVLIIGFAMSLLFVVSMITHGLERRRRIKHDLCLACGYPLIDEVGMVCPECGPKEA